MFRIKLLLLSLCSFHLFAGDSSPIREQECEVFNADFADQQSPTKLLQRNAKDQLAELTFKFNVIGYGENGRNVQEIDETPHVAFPVENGWLLGSDRGEWGGSLVFKSNSGEQQNIIDDNIEDIYKFSYGYIVTAGLGHMGLSRGSIYLVTIENGKYIAEKLHSLVAPPKTSWLTSSGELLINHRGHASSVLTSNGTLYRVSCKNFVRE